MLFTALHLREDAWMYEAPNSSHNVDVLFDILKNTAVLQCNALKFDDVHFVQTIYWFMARNFGSLETTRHCHRWKKFTATEMSIGHNDCNCTLSVSLSLCPSASCRFRINEWSTYYTIWKMDPSTHKILFISSFENKCFTLNKQFRFNSIFDAFVQFQVVSLKNKKPATNHTDATILKSFNWLEQKKNYRYQVKRCNWFDLFQPL